jgi:biotin carboxyl carrier protein
MQAKVKDKTYEIELISKEENNVRISVNGEIYEMDIVMSETGFCSLLYEGHSYNAESVCHGEGKYTITTNFKHFNVELSNPQKKHLKNPSDAVADKNQSVIKSSMPGKIVKICVSENEKVKKGNPLLVIEAMKMQNTYTAAQDAVVEEIKIKEGESVLRDQILISFQQTDK